MAREFAQAFYQSRQWKKCRKAFFISKHGLCERCGSGGKIVHHKTYITPANINNPYITLNFDNLELVCHECHEQEHKGSPSSAKGTLFDDDGNLISPPYALK